MRTGFGTTLILTLGLTVSQWACGHSSQVPLAPGPLTELAVSGASNTGASIAAANGRVVVTWVATVNEEPTIYAAVSQDDGRTFGAATRVNDLAGDVRVGGDQAPRVTMDGAGRISVVWTSRLYGASRIRVAQSRDGPTFLPAATLSGDDLSGIRGWASVANTASGGVLHAAWLDGRDSPTAAAAGRGTHQHGAHVMRQDLFAATWTADGNRHEARVATDVCFCCKTGVAVAPDGVTYVAWRHVYPTNLRDMAVAASFDGGRTFGAPVRVSEDHWEIEGCPEDGPAIGVDAEGTLHIAWPTLVQGATPKKGVFYSSSTDRGRTFTSRQLLNVGTPLQNAAHPQVASLGDTVAVVWDEDSADGARIELRTSSHSAPNDARMLTLGAGPHDLRPAVALSQEAVLVAWTTQDHDASRVRVQRIAR